MQCIARFLAHFAQMHMDHMYLELCYLFASCWVRDYVKTAGMLQWPSGFQQMIHSKANEKFEVTSESQLIYTLEIVTNWQPVTSSSRWEPLGKGQPRHI